MSLDVIQRELSRLHTLSVSWTSGAYFRASKTGRYIRQDPDGSLHVVGFVAGDKAQFWSDSNFIGPVHESLRVTHNGKFMEPVSCG